MLTNLLPHLAQMDTNNLYFIFYSTQQSGFVQAIPDKFHKVAVKYLTSNPYIRVLWEQFSFPFYLLCHGIDVLYSVGNTTSILAPCKVVLLMENVNPYSKLNLPWSAKERLRFLLLRLLGWLSARRATKIRFVSQNSLDRMASQIKVSSKKCVVIPHGVSEKTIQKGEVVYKETPARNYLLTIGANGPHRNTVRLLQAFSLLVTQYGYAGDLIVVGNTGSSRWRQDLDELVQKLELSGRVVLKGEVPHRDMAMYFQQADVFVFPSIEETFGIPVIEAMGLGVPVTVSDCDLDPARRGKCFNPFREICGEAAHYFNPFDVEDMASNINYVVSNEPYKQQLIGRGRERVKKYSVKGTAEALVRLFEEAATA